MVTRRAKLALLIALTLPGCTTYYGALEAANLYPDVQTCAPGYADGSCQQHWMVCAGFCEGGPIDPNTQTCWSYRRGWRRLCADVRAVPFSVATCIDYDRGICGNVYECDPRPEGCE